MNIQILAFTERPEFKTFLEFELKSMTGVDPTVHITIKDLDSILDVIPMVDVLVLDTPKVRAEFDLFLNKIIKYGDKVKHLIIMGTGELKANNLKFFHRGDVASMLSYLKEALGATEPKSEGWISVPVTALYHFNKLPFDLYVKLSDEKYVKRIPALEYVDETTVDSFKKRGILEMHFHREHNKTFSRLLIQNMLTKVDGEYTDDNLELKARTEVFDTVKEIVQALGLSPKVVEVCDSIVAEMTVDVIQGGGKLGKHVERLQGNAKLTFHYRFVELTCYIGTQMLKALDPKNYGQESRRFIFAAFFCDMTLSDQEHLNHLSLDNLRVLKTQEQKSVQDHACKASQLIAKHKDAPLDIAIVIKQHHGALDGMGFPVKKSPLLTNLTKVLILSQELAYGMLTKTHTPAIEVLKTMVKKHEGSALHELVELFESTLEKD